MEVDKNRVMDNTIDATKEVAETLLDSGEIITKYEKNNKPYRQPKYKSVGKRITCDKCGSPYSLTKYRDEETKKEYWFCKSCIMERVKEILDKKRK